MKQLLIISQFLLFVSLSVAQSDTVVVEIQVNDKKYGESIQNVNVTIQNKSDIVYRKTGTKGICRFNAFSDDRVLVKLSHSQFLGTENEFHISKKAVKGDTIYYLMSMEYIKTQDIEEMVVSAPGVPATVYGSKRVHVADFELQNDGNVILLTYPKRLKKGSELILYDGMKVKNSFQVPDVAEELVRDYRGNPHVICERNVFGIHAGSDVIGISTLTKDYYVNYLAPILDTNKSKLYFSTFNPDYPAFEYFSYDQLDSTYKRIMGIEDELMMELYRSEYKWVDVRTKLWAKNKEIQTGIDAEIWVGANYFTQSIYYKELYAPLFHRNDSLFVFDYYKDKLFTYNELGEALDSVEIYHHYNPRRTGWKKQLIQDRKTGQIYALFDRAGWTYLGWVDTKTGEITEQVKLEYRYVDKVAIHDNFVYYIYRPFESIQKKYLYKERLPYEFGGASVPSGDVVEE
jgi:hypothetical protein